MSGIDRIYQKIIEDANDQAKLIIDKASASREESLEELSNRMKVYEAEQIASAKREAENIIKRSNANRNLEGKKEVLTVKQNLISQAFDKAYEKMMELEGEDIFNLYTSLIRNSLREGENELIFSEKDKKDLGEKIVDYFRDNPRDNAKVSLSSSLIEDDRGVIVKNGKILSNSTFTSLLKYKKSELDSDVMKILFEGGS